MSDELRAAAERAIHAYDQMTALLGMAEDGVMGDLVAVARAYLAEHPTKWKRSEAKQYMLMETIGDGPKICGHDSWLCPYKEFAYVLHDAIDGMDDPAMIATIRFTFMEMDDIEFEEYCIENGVEWEG